MAPTKNLVTKIKVQLKLSIARLRMVQARDEAETKVARRTMAQLLEAGKEDSARIRVENIIRSDITTELHEILELYCELLLARAGLLDQPTCDPGLEEAVQSLIYAAPKTEIKELQTVRLLLAERFGKDYVLAATDNRDGKVSPKVVRKLSVTPPREELVVGYLEEIAKAYGVRCPRRDEDLGEAPSLIDDVVEGDGSGNDNDNDTHGDEKTPSTPSAKVARTHHDLSHATPPKTAVTPVQVNPPSPSTDNIRPKVTLNAQELKPVQPSSTAAAAPVSRPAGTTAPKTSSLADPASRRLVVKKKDNVDDELARRFAELKRS